MKQELANIAVTVTESVSMEGFQNVNQNDSELMGKLLNAEKHNDHLVYDNMNMQLAEDLVVDHDGFTYRREFWRNLSHHGWSEWKIEDLYLNELVFDGKDIVLKA